MQRTQSTKCTEDLCRMTMLNSWLKRLGQADEGKDQEAERSSREVIFATIATKTATLQEIVLIPLEEETEEANQDVLFVTDLDTKRSIVQIEEVAEEERALLEAQGEGQGHQERREANFQALEHHLLLKRRRDLHPPDVTEVPPNQIAKSPGLTVESIRRSTLSLQEEESPDLQEPKTQATSCPNLVA